MPALPLLHLLLARRYRLAHPTAPLPRPARPMAPSPRPALCLRLPQTKPRLLLHPPHMPPFLLPLLVLPVLPVVLPLQATLEVSKRPSLRW